MPSIADCTVLESHATFVQIHQGLSFSRRTEASGASLTLLSSLVDVREQQDALDAAYCDEETSTLALTFIHTCRSRVPSTIVDSRLSGSLPPPVLGIARLRPAGATYFMFNPGVNEMTTSASKPALTPIPRRS